VQEKPRHTRRDPPHPPCPNANADYLPLANADISAEPPVHPPTPTTNAAEPLFPTSDVPT